MSTTELTVDFHEKEILITALNFYLEDLERDRNNYSSTSKLISSGIMTSINSCRVTLKNLQQNKELSSENVLTIYLALSAYLKFVKYCVNNSTSENRNFTLDLRRDTKHLLNKIKPIYDFLLSQ